MDAPRAADSLAYAAAGRRGRLRPGRFDRYLIRAAAGPFALVLLAVVASLMLERALRLIYELAATGADIGYLFPLLLQLVPYYLELAVPLAFMASLALLVAGLDQGLELEAMLAGGMSLARIAAPLMALGLVLSGFALFAGGWLEPHGRYGYRALRIEALNAGRISELQPGALLQPVDGLALTFDRRLPDGAAGRVFLWQRLDTGEELVVASGSGRVGFAPAGRLLGIDFRDGRYLAERPRDEPVSVDFAELAFRQTLKPRDSRWERGWDQKELTLSELMAEARTGARGLPAQAVEAEFYGRIARAAIIPLVPLLVLPLAFATKRRGRALGILLCVTVLAFAHHGLNYARGVALMGTADPPLVTLGAAGLLWVLAGALFVSARRIPGHSPVHAVLDRIAAAATRLAPRRRGVAGVAGRTLGSYLVWELGKWMLLALLAVVTFFQLIELIDRSDAFAERGIGLGGIAHYAALRLPAIVQQAVPMAALVGAMTAFSLFAGAREMTAIRAAGVSQWRVLAMALPVPLLLAAAMFVLAEWVTPASQLRLATWWNASEPAGPGETPQARWFRIGDRIVRAGAASTDGTRLADLAIFARDDVGRLRERVVAERADFAAGGWTLHGIATTRLDGQGVVRATSEAAAWRVQLAPEDVAAFFAATPAFSAGAAQRSLDYAAPVSSAGSVFETRLYRSAAEPLAPLVMLLLALPLAFVAPRTGRSWPALLYAAGGGLVYLVADGVLTVAGQVGYVPSALGAWAAPAIALSVGVSVLALSER